MLKKNKCLNLEKFLKSFDTILFFTNLTPFTKGKNVAKIVAEIRQNGCI